MADPDQLLAQQANQTMAVMQLIGNNTQRVFENTFRVQQSQINTGLQVAGMLEQKRVNDVRINEINQSMRFRAQEQAWQATNQAFSEKLMPLKMQQANLAYEQQFKQAAMQELNPFLADVRGEFASFVNDMPELAGEAQNVYATSINNVLQRSITDPNLDISSEIEKEKVKMRQWVEKQKAPKTFLGQVAQGAVDGVNDVFGTKFDPLASIKSERKALDKDTISRASAVYQSFGGDPKVFVQKNDPEYRKNIDSIIRVATVTKKLPDPSILAQMPVEDQEMLIKRVQDEQTFEQLIDINKANQTAINSLISEKEDLIRGGQPTNPIDQQINLLRGKQSRITQEMNRLSGFDDDQPDPKSPQQEEPPEVKKAREAISRITGDLPTDADTSTMGRVNLSEKLGNKIDILVSDKDQRSSLRNRFISGNLQDGDFSAIAEQASELEIFDFARDQDFANYIGDVAIPYGDLRDFRNEQQSALARLRSGKLNSKGEYTQERKKQDIKLLRPFVARYLAKIANSR